MTKLVSFCLFLISFSIFGQDGGPAKFGKISAAELKTKSYNIDDRAAAVIISDVGSSKITGNLRGWFSIEFKHFKRVHILKESAYDLANVEVFLYSDATGQEELKSLKAHTYNLENGKVVEKNVDLKKSVYTAVVDKNHIVKKFVLPAVKEGSIIEFEYTISSDFIFNLQPWKFQSNYPTLWSEYNVSIPEFLYYVFFQQGAITKTQATREENFRATNTTTAGRSTSASFIATVNDYHMVMKNVPAVKEESFVSAMENHLAKVEFQLAEYRAPLSPQTIMGDWEDVTQDLLNDESLGGQLKKDNGWLNTEMGNILQDAKSDRQKARNIFNYLQKNFKCTDHNKLYVDQSLRNVFKDKKGSEAEVNLLLVIMLRKIGLTADPVMLSTKPHGYTFSNYPVVERFNYVICRALIEGRSVYLDASRPNLGFGRLDWECYNGHARVINKEATAVQLSADSLTEASASSLLIVFGDEGEIVGRMEQRRGYYESLSARDQISESGLAAFIKAREDEKSSEAGEVRDYRIDYLPNLDEQIQVSYELKLKTGGADLVYLDPFMGEGFTENPFTADRRNYPIEMPYTLDETFVSRIELPKNYEIKETPGSARLNFDKEGRSFFEYLIEVAGPYISLRSRIRVHRSYFLAEEYKVLRDFFTIVVNKQNEKIVLKKLK